MFFGLPFTTISVLLACAFLLSSHLHEPLISCVCKTHSQHSVWFPSLLLFNLEEATSFKICHSLSLIKPALYSKNLPLSRSKRTSAFSLMETISLTLLPALVFWALYHLVSFSCPSMIFFTLSLLRCPISSVPRNDLFLTGQNLTWGT